MPTESKLSEIEAKVAKLEAELAVVKADSDRYRLLVQQAADGLVIHDDDGRFLEVNQRAADILGYTVEELSCLGMREIEPDYNAFGVRERLRALTGNEVLTVEGRPQRKDGVPIVVEVCVGLFTAPGTDRRYVAFLRDITGRKETVRALQESSERFREMLEKAQAQLVRVERLATFGTLSAGVGHELNNLAQIFTGTVALLKRDAGALPALAPIIDSLDGATAAVALHAKHLLRTGAAEEDREEIFQAGEFAESTVAMLRQAGRLKYIRVDVDVRDPEAIVRMKRARLEQALVNLLTNAADSLGDGKGAIRVLVYTSGKRVVFSVQDEGEGIDPSDVEHIFDPYFTTRTGARGGGLGLLVVREIVRAASGEVQVDSALGQGTTVLIDFPLYLNESP